VAWLVGSNALKGFGALWDNVYSYLSLITLNYSVFIDGQFTISVIKE
jgi:hypothetical protein